MTDGRGEHAPKASTTAGAQTRSSRRGTPAAGRVLNTRHSEPKRAHEGRTHAMPLPNRRTFMRRRSEDAPIPGIVCLGRGRTIEAAPMSGHRASSGLPQDRPDAPRGATEGELGVGKRDRRNTATGTAVHHPSAAVFVTRRCVFGIIDRMRGMAVGDQMNRVLHNFPRPWRQKERQEESAKLKDPGHQASRPTLAQPRPIPPRVRARPGLRRLTPSPPILHSRRARPRHHP